MVFVALACAALLTSCGGDYRSVTFETETVSWTLFTQPFNLLPQGGYAAEVQGLVEMDTASGCVYLGNLDFDLSYPVVWPHGTEITEDGAVLLADGRTAPDGEWVYGGGGYLHTEWIATRCPGINRDCPAFCVRGD